MSAPVFLDKKMAGAKAGLVLQTSGQQHEQQDQDDQSGDADWAVAPAAAVVPGRQHADQDEDEYD
jgi:hypothetical protein